MGKLTLSIDDQVVEEAKRLAKERGTSVSAMFTDFIRALAEPETPGTELGPLTRRAMGLASLPDRKSYRDVLEEALLEKHGPES